MNKIRVVKFFLFCLCALQTGGMQTIRAERAGSAYLNLTNVKQKSSMAAAFENIVLSAKKNDWKAVNSAVESVGKEIVALDKIYNADLMDGIKKSIIGRDAGKALNFMANAVFLSLREELKLASGNEFKDSVQAKAHIAAARSDYEDVLSLNLARKDSVLNTKIIQEFDKLTDSMKSIDIEGYRMAENAIEEGILKVYVQFKKLDGK